MFYIVDKNTRELIRQSRTPFNIDEEVQPPDPHIQLRRVDDDNTQPSFDPATHKLVRQFVDDDSQFIRTFQWVAVAMTAEEIEGYEQQQEDQVDLAQIIQVYQDMKNGVGTATHRMVRVEKVCAFLLRNEFRNQ